MNIILLRSKFEPRLSLNTKNISSTHHNKGYGFNIFTKVGRGMKNTHHDFFLLLPPLYKNINPLTFSLLNIAVLFFVS